MVYEKMLEAREMLSELYPDCTVFVDVQLAAYHYVVGKDTHLTETFTISLVKDVVLTQQSDTDLDVLLEKIIDAM